MYKNGEMDMVNGPLFRKMIAFSIPVVLSTILQFTFNAADTIIAGRFAGSDSLAAIGSTTPVVNMIINFFIGLSICANVVTSQLYGKGNIKGLKESIYTSFAIAFVCGIIILAFGPIFAKVILKSINTPADILDKAVLYIRIYFFSMPASVIFNFGSGILRTFGDTKKPLYFLIVSGLVHIALNFLFVTVVHWDVAGLAVSSVISQWISALLVMKMFFTGNEVYRIDFKKVQIYRRWSKSMLRIGIPAGLSNLVFSFTNIVLQTAINSLGAAAIAGNSIASSIEYIPYAVISAFQSSAVTFTSQNYGAGKYNRVKKVFYISCILGFLGGLVFGGACAVYGDVFASIYSKDADIIRYAAIRMMIIGPFYTIGSFCETIPGIYRGLGRSLSSMIILFIFTCSTRIIYTLTLYRKFNTFEMLYIIYPISWILSAVVFIAGFFIIYKKIKKRNPINSD